jgi:hypothetical protein
MPANPKYLTHNKTQRFVKVSAAILGGFLASASAMLAWAAWSESPKTAFFTYTFFMFIQWCALMLVAFLFQNGWKCWAWYGGFTAVMTALYLMKAGFLA